MYVLVKRWLALIDWGCMSEDDCCLVFRLDSENDRYVFQVGLLVLLQKILESLVIFRSHSGMHCCWGEG